MTDKNHTIPEDNWNDIDWTKVQKDVMKTQARISKASRRGDCKTAKRLQNLLITSRAPKLLAVEMATSGKGARTPGVDGVRSPSATQKWQMAMELDVRTKPLPLRRTTIEQRGKTRDLFVPTILDRAREILIAMALAPQWEHRLPPHMYGSRKGRGASDALGHLWRNIARKPKWADKTDFASFFEEFKHAALLDKLDAHPKIVKAITRMLKSGRIRRMGAESNNRGVPTGGPLSPLLANIVLSDIQRDLEKEFPPHRKVGGKRIDTTPAMALYVDDLVVLHPTEDVIREVHEFLQGWAAKLGLRLHPEKTRIAPTIKGSSPEYGFTFLGFRIRQFPQVDTKRPPGAQASEPSSNPLPKA